MHLKTDSHSPLLRLLEVSGHISRSAQTEQDAFRRGLELICKTYGWPVGHVYVLSEDKEELISSKIWYLENTSAFDTFRKVTEQTSFQKGIGLPGRVYKSNQPAWIRDVTKDPNFPRAQQAQDIGVRAAFAFPIFVSGKIQAVWEFYAALAFEPDHDLIIVIDAVGSQIGKVLERIHSEGYQKQTEILAGKSKEMEESIEHEITEISHRNTLLESGLKELTDVMGVVNMVALNARIEAYRLGSEGSSFVAVTNEIQEISHKITNSGEQLNKEVLELKKNNQILVNRIGEMLELLGEVRKLRHGQ